MNMIGKIVFVLILAASVAYFATPHQTVAPKPVPEEGYYTWDGVHELICYSSGACYIVSGGGGRMVEV